MKYKTESKNHVELLQLANKEMDLIKEMQRSGVEDHLRQHHKVCNLLKEIDNLKNPGQSSTTDDEEILEESLAVSDNLSLPQDGINFTQFNHGHTGGRPSSPCSGEKVNKPIIEIKI